MPTDVVAALATRNDPDDLPATRAVEMPQAASSEPPASSASDTGSTYPPTRRAEVSTATRPSSAPEQTSKATVRSDQSIRISGTVQGEVESKHGSSSKRAPACRPGSQPST